MGFLVPNARHAHLCLLLLSGPTQEARQEFEQERLSSVAISWSIGYSIPLLTPVVPAPFGTKRGKNIIVNEFGCNNVPAKKIP